MDIINVLILAQKELSDARRNRWFILYALVFAALTLALAWLGLAGMGRFGLAGFGRTGASLTNLILLIVPLMGLTLGALSLAGERERGTLLYLLAQPLTVAELLLGKFVGLGLALTAALGLGFGLTAVLIAANGGADWRPFVALAGLTCLLALVALSLGLLISAAVHRSATAIGIALFLWLFLVLFGDLGVMSTALVLQLSVEQLLGLTLVNPLQVFKLAAVASLNTNLEILGPAGVYALRRYGGRLMPALVALLLVWAGLPLLLTHAVFKRKGAV